MKKTLLALLLLTLCSTYKAHAQGMAINTSGNAANSSAMLDVSSTTQGVLVPRMTAAQRGSITGVQGLLVYQTDAPAGFYYYDGSWIALSTSASSLNAANLSSGTVPAARGGAGTVNGMLKADGAGNVSAAAAGTDYLNSSSSLNSSKLTGALPALDGSALTNLPSSGGSGTVTSVSSANTDISVATATTTPVLTLNTGTTANKIVKLDNNGKLPAIDGSALTNLPSSGGGGGAPNLGTPLAKSSNYTIQTTDVVVYATVDGKTFTLPSASAAGTGKVIYVMCGPGQVTVQPAAGNTLYVAGNGSLGALTVYSVTLVSDGGSQWICASQLF